MSRLYFLNVSKNIVERVWEKEKKNKLDDVCEASWRPIVEMYTGIVRFEAFGARE